MRVCQIESNMKMKSQSLLWKLVQKCVNATPIRRMPLNRIQRKSNSPASCHNAFHVVHSFQFRETSIKCRSTYLCTFQWIFNSSRHPTINLCEHFIFEYSLCRELSTVHLAFAFFLPPAERCLRCLVGNDWCSANGICVFQCFWSLGPVTPPVHAKYDWCEFVSSISGPPADGKIRKIFL